MKRVLIILIWISFFITSFLIYYVHHFLPEGPSYSTGEVVCMNDERGPCGEKYQEDVRNLDIPNWAKFFKTSDGWLLWWALLFAGGIMSNKKDGNEG